MALLRDALIETLIRHYTQAQQNAHALNQTSVAQTAHEPRIIAPGQPQLPQMSGGGVTNPIGAQVSNPAAPVAPRLPGAVYGDSPPPGAIGRAQDPGGNWYWWGLGDINLGNPNYLGANENMRPAGPAKFDPTFGWRNDFDPNHPGFIMGEN